MKATLVGDIITVSGMDGPPVDLPNNRATYQQLQDVYGIVLVQREMGGKFCVGSGSVAFKTLSRAERAMATVREGHQRDAQSFATYPCATCSRFHIARKRAYSSDGMINIVAGPVMVATMIDSPTARLSIILRHGCKVVQDTATRSKLCCVTGKVSFATPGAATHFLGRKHYLDGNPHLKVYECEHCEMSHFGTGKDGVHATLRRFNQATTEGQVPPCPPQ